MPFGSEPNGGRPPSRMRFQRKMDPRISGGTIVDMFNKEFRTLLILIISPAPSSICPSKSRMRSMSTSRPMLSDQLVTCKYPETRLLTPSTTNLHGLDGFVDDHCGHETARAYLRLDRGGGDKERACYS